MAGNQWDDEPRNPNEPPHRAGGPRDPWESPEGRPPKPGMSSGMKAFLIILAIVGTCLVLCCGIGGYFIWSAARGIKHSENPADVNAARDEIAKIKLPEGFKPKDMFGMDNFMMKMAVVVYENPAVHGRIMLMEMNVKVGQPQQNKAQMRAQLEQQGMARQSPLTNVKSSSKIIKIKGRDCDFEFVTGQDPATKKKRDQVSGVFDGSQGPVLFSMEVDDSGFHQDEVVKMLESIQ